MRGSALIALPWSIQAACTAAKPTNRDAPRKTLALPQWPAPCRSPWPDRAGGPDPQERPHAELGQLELYRALPADLDARIGPLVEELVGTQPDPARRVAQQEGATLRALVEEGLQRSLEARRQAARRQLDFPSYGGNGLTDEFQGAPWSRIRDEIYREHGA
mgnify:CR=1 FL=1